MSVSVAGPPPADCAVTHLGGKKENFFVFPATAKLPIFESPVKRYCFKLSSTVLMLIVSYIGARFAALGYLYRLAFHHRAEMSHPKGRAHGRSVVRIGGIYFGLPTKPLEHCGVEFQKLWPTWHVSSLSKRYKKARASKSSKLNILKKKKQPGKFYILYQCFSYLFFPGSFRGAGCICLAPGLDRWTPHRHRRLHSNGASMLLCMYNLLTVQKYKAGAWSGGGTAVIMNWTEN